MADLSALGSTNPFLGTGNPYLQQQIDANMADVVRNFNMVQRPAMNAAAVNSGSFGNEGLAQQDQEAQRQLQMSLGNIGNAARGADYGQQQAMYQWQKQFDRSGQQWEDAFNRDVYNDAYGQNMGNAQFGLAALGQLNRTNDADIAATTAVQNTPLNYWQQFNQQANSVGQGYGTSTQSSPLYSNPWASMAGGAQLGSSLYSRLTANDYGSSPASVASSGAYPETTGGGGVGGFGRDYTPSYDTSWWSSSAA